MTAPAPRYPFASLLRLLHCDESTAKARLGLDHRQVARYMREGLTERRACELAALARVHEYDAWPEMLEHRIAASSKSCEECGAAYVPYRHYQRFCSSRCQQRQLQRVRKRERYQTDPEFAEKAKANARRYYEDCRDYVRSRQQKARSAA